MDKSSRIYVAGHRGLVGSSLLKTLDKHGYKNLIYKPHSELDLINQNAVNNFFSENKIDFVFLAAARAGGIHANQTLMADFAYENLMIACNVIKAAAHFGVQKLLFLGSSCIYPKNCPQPIKEEYLLSGPLEKTNEGYALAKITGLKLCEYFYKQYGKKFISAMPCNLYGPHDNYHPTHSHVIPALLRRFHEAKIKKLHEVSIWGSGSPLREFLYVDDLSEALVLLMNQYDSPETINIGSEKEVSIYELAHLIKETTDYKGALTFDQTYPDGTPRKILDCSKMKNLFRWSASSELKNGLKSAYSWAVENNKFS